MSQRVYIVSQQLIAANVERISALSWDGYQREGRGAVVIEGQTTEKFEIAGGPLDYVSDKEAQETRDGWPTEDVAGIVKAYNPESEVIVIVRWRGEVGVYRFKPHTPPRAAYEGLKKALRSI